MAYEEMLNQDQRQRWVGTALQEIEPKLRIVRGYRHLKELRETIKNLNFKEILLDIVQFQLTMGLRRLEQRWVRMKPKRQKN